MGLNTVSVGRQRRHPHQLQQGGGLPERVPRVVLDTGESRWTLRVNGYSGRSESTINASKLTHQRVPSPEERVPQESTGKPFI